MPLSKTDKSRFNITTKEMLPAVMAVGAVLISVLF